jgi:hypothetical protein
MKTKIFTLLVTVTLLATITSCEKTRNPLNGSSTSSKSSGPIHSDKEAQIVTNLVWDMLDNASSQGALDYTGSTTRTNYKITGSYNNKGYATMNGSASKSSDGVFQTNTIQGTIVPHNWTNGSNSIDGGSIEFRIVVYSNSSYKEIRTAEGYNVKVSGSYNGYLVNDVVSFNLQRYHGSGTQNYGSKPVAGSVYSSSGESYDGSIGFLYY